MVAGNDLALLVHSQTPVSITVIGKAHIQAVLHHKLLQHLNMGRACPLVDIQAIGLGIDHIGLGAQSIKNTLGNIPGSTVGAVQANLLSPEGEQTQADQVTDIAISACHIVHGAAHMVPGPEGQGLPLLSEQLQLAVQVQLHQFDGLFIHLFTVAVNELDTVVVVGIVAGGDHNTAVKFIHPGHIGHRGGGGHVKQIRIGTGGSKTCHQSILKHIAGAAGILADNHSGRLRILGPALQFPIVPAQKTSHLKSMVRSEIHIGFAAEAVSSKILAHRNTPLLFGDDLAAGFVDAVCRNHTPDAA